MHPLYPSDSLLTVVQVIEASDEICHAKIISEYFSSSHERNASEIGHKLMLISGSSIRHLRLFKMVNVKLGHFDYDDGIESCLREGEHCGDYLLGGRFHL